MNVKRKPVLAQSRKVLGIDPGLTATGLAILTGTPAQPVLENLELIKTPATPAKVKKATKTKVADDDLRRMRAQWEALQQRIIGCAALGVETYTPILGQAGRSGWKTAWSYQVAVCAAWQHGLGVYPARPQELKRFLLGSVKGGKVEVMQAVMARIPGLAVALEQYPPGVWEHLADAAGHALLVFQKIG